MLKLNNVLHPDICDGDIIFDIIWAKRFQGQNTLCVHHTRPGHSLCIPWMNTLYTWSVLVLGSLDSN